jgi:hypothetical protein
MAKESWQNDWTKMELFIQKYKTHSYYSNKVDKTDKIMPCTNNMPSIKSNENIQKNSN